MKKGTTYAFSHNYARIKVDSYDSLTLEKKKIFYNVVIRIKSVWYKDQNDYHYNILLEFLSWVT